MMNIKITYRFFVLFGIFQLIIAIGFSQITTMKNKGVYIKNSTGIKIYGNLEIDYNASGNGIVTNEGNIELKGDLYFNDRNSFPGNGLLYFNGTVQQNIWVFNNGTGNYSNVIVNNSNYVFLQNPFRITNSLEFQNSGHIDATTNRLIFADNITGLAGVDDNSHVIGRVTKEGDDPFVFPVGNVNYYRYISITGGNISTDEFTTEYQSGQIQTGTAGIGSFKSVNNCEYWEMTGIGSTQVTTSFLDYLPCDYFGTGTFTDVNNARVARWDGTAWFNEGGVNQSVPNNPVPGEVMSSTNMDFSSYPGMVSVTTAEACFEFMVSQTDVSCFGGQDGTIQITINGGTAPYTFDWGGADPNALAAGNYTVNIADDGGCTATATVVINEPTAIQLTMSSSDENCSNSDGTAAVSVLGGVAPYAFNWSNGNNTSTIVSLSAGTYTVSVTDVNGCISTGSVEVLSTGDITLTTGFSDVSCNGGNDGTATVAASGGTAPYTYDWNGADPNNLSAGNYTVIVTDANGCTTSAAIVINEPATLSVATTSTDVSCNGGNDGTAIVAASGGTAPYTYDWNGTDPNNLSAGNYTVVVADANGCTASAIVVINEPEAIGITVSDNQTTYYNYDNQGNVNCVVSADIELISIANGVAPYTITWSDPALTGYGPHSVCPLVEGAYTYEVTVEDATGCSVSASIFVEAIYLDPTIYSPSVGNENYNDNKVCICHYDAVSGNYQLINDVNTSAIIAAPCNNMNSLCYYLDQGDQITPCDGTECDTGTMKTSLVDKNDTEEEIISSFNIYPNPINDLLFVTGSELPDNYSIVVTDMLGQLCYQNSFNGPTVINRVQIGENGMYNLHIIGRDGTVLKQQKLILVK